MPAATRDTGRKKEVAMNSTKEMFMREELAPRVCREAVGVEDDMMDTTNLVGLGTRLIDKDHRGIIPISNKSAIKLNAWINGFRAVAGVTT